jgi:hypothetical protein
MAPKSCFRISGKRSEKLPPPRDCKGDERRVGWDKAAAAAGPPDTATGFTQVKPGRPASRTNPSQDIWSGNSKSTQHFPEGGKGAFDGQR